MTDDTTLTGPPETFDLIGAIEGSTFPETTVRFLFDSAAATSIAQTNLELQKLLALGRSDEYETLEKVYFDAIEALEPVTFKVTVKSVPRKVKKAVFAELDAAHPPKVNVLTGIEEQSVDRIEFYNVLNWRAHIIRFEDPQGRVVDGPLDRDLIQKLLDNAPEASIAAIENAIEELETGSKAGYEQAVRNIDFLSEASQEA